MQKDLVVNTEGFLTMQDVVSCSICCGIITDPVQCTQCENSFCKTCIDDWKKKSDDCPFKCVQSKMKPSRTIRVLLSQLIFKCPNKCGTEIPHDEYDKHCNEACTKLDYKEKYKSLIESFKALKLENGKLMSKHSDTSPIIYKSPCHQHPLVYIYYNRLEWKCDVCGVLYDKTASSYACIDCNYDFCEKCRMKELNNSHEHMVVFNYMNRSDWKCDKCKIYHAGNTNGSYVCKVCEFDLCEECKKKEL